jgi:hypothetical protein
MIVFLKIARRINQTFEKIRSENSEKPLREY